MRVTDFTRKTLDYRRTRRRLMAEGFEEVGEGGGRLWELNRGWRHRQRIHEVKIAPGGRSLFVRIGP